jgi:hypothetical protein
MRPAPMARDPLYLLWVPDGGGGSRSEIPLCLVRSTSRGDLLVDDLG